MGSCPWQRTCDGRRGRRRDAGTFFHGEGDEERKPAAFFDPGVDSELTAQLLDNPRNNSKTQT